MGIGFTVSAGDGPGGYRVETIEGCKLIFGPIPIDDFAGLAKSLPKRAVLEPDVARIYGATHAMGLPGNLSRLAERGAPAAMDRIRQLYFGSGDVLLGVLDLELGEAGVRWLATGRQGNSSLALFTLLTGVRPNWYRGEQFDLPRDPSDFWRCRLLLEEVAALAPLLPRLAQRTSEPEVAGWAYLANQWDSLSNEMDNEAPDWRKGKGPAPRTAARLRDICAGRFSSDEPLPARSSPTGPL